MADVIMACDEHREKTTELEFSEKLQRWYCPHCGKYEWPAIHEEAKYDEKLKRNHG